MEDKAFCILSLGSNMGDRRKTIDGAIAILEASSEITGLKRASYYETEPVGYEDQAWFLNTCVSFETSLEPLELLDLTQSIEQEFHRERTIHWGPRTLGHRHHHLRRSHDGYRTPYDTPSEVYGARICARTDVRAYRYRRAHSGRQGDQAPAGRHLSYSHLKFIIKR